MLENVKDDPVYWIFLYLLLVEERMLSGYKNYNNNVKFSATKFYCCKDVLKHLIVREILNWKWWYHDCDDDAMDHNFLWWSNASWFLMMDQMHHDYDDDLMHHDCDDDQIYYRGSDVSRVIDNSKWISLELSMTRCPLATAWRCQMREAPWNQQLQLLGLPSASSTPPPCHQER